MTTSYNILGILAMKFYEILHQIQGYNFILNLKCLYTKFKISLETQGISQDSVQFLSKNILK